MTKINPKVGDTIIAHDTLNIINDCVGVVTFIGETFPTEMDYLNKTNSDIGYVCKFDRGSFVLKLNQIKRRVK